MMATVSSTRSIHGHCAALGEPGVAARAQRSRASLSGRSLSPLLLVPLAAIAVWFFVTGVCVAGEPVYPLPEFTSGYQVPDALHPPPRATWRHYADLAYLVCALGLATYFALVLRWRGGLFVLAVVSLIWLGFWRKGCVCPIGAIQNVALAIGDSSYVIPPMVVAIFLLPLIFTLFFGRVFCAAVCPLGAVQELVAVRPARVPRWLDHALRLLPHVYLGAAVVLAGTGAAFLICRYDPFVNMFRLGGSAGMLVFGGAMLLLGLMVGRPYCRYLCPYGAIMAMLSPLARWHVRIPPDECINCRMCEDACPYGAILESSTAPPPDRRWGRRRLGLLILALPAIVGVFAWAGYHLHTPLAMLHPNVSLAVRVRAELADPSIGTTEASDNFRRTGRPAEELFSEAEQIRQRFVPASTLFGAWVGLVLGAKLIGLAVHRVRSEYQPDKAHCVSCGRCFWYCPVEQARLGLIKDIELEAYRQSVRSPVAGADKSHAADNLHGPDKSHGPEK